MGASLIGSPAKILYRLSEFRQRYGTTKALWKCLYVVLQKVFRTSIYSVVWLISSRSLRWPR